MNAIKVEPLQQDNNRFQILNGNWLEGFPRVAKQESPVDNTLQLDQTGEYLVMKKGGERHSEQPMSAREDVKRFYSHAFLFLEKRDIIYSDSRMFLAPVPVQNGLAYSGTNGFRRPTLGIYLEWWERCKEAHIMREEGERLVWFISGSPLSGCNLCASVDRDGESKTTPVPTFPPVYAGFSRVNSRYDEIKDLYEAYTLEQVIEKLQC